MTKKVQNLQWFEVSIAGRLVDCIKAADVLAAMDEATSRWDRTMEILQAGSDIDVTMSIDALRPNREIETAAAADAKLGLSADTKGWPYSGYWTADARI